MVLSQIAKLRKICNTAPLILFDNSDKKQRILPKNAICARTTLHTS
jgi:hypothetical protein